MRINMKRELRINRQVENVMHTDKEVGNINNNTDMFIYLSSVIIT